MLERCNQILTLLFFVCYSYQFVYIAAVLLLPKGRKQPAGEAETVGTGGSPSAGEERSEGLSAPRSLPVIGVLIAAKNEEAVIGALLASLDEQDYPKELMDVFVVADNCTDGTARAAREGGAFVCERFDRSRIGKGYALNYLLGKIRAGAFSRHDAYIVLDADNVLAPDFVSRMAEKYAEGFEAVTCYRNSKNYGDNWISAGYALWFIRESQYLNRARAALGTSCAVSGTGFLFSDRLLKRWGGWNWFLLTEDIEFSIANIVRGERIGYAEKAMIYDEQPTEFGQSVAQRMRWARGYLQVFGAYGKDLVRGVFSGSFACFDMTMNIMPAAVLSILGLGIDLISAFLSLRSGILPAAELICAAESLGAMCLTLFAAGLITLATEWKEICCPAGKKILYLFTFPLFMLTYLPISVAAVFKDPGWQKIRHTKSMKLSEIKGEGNG